MILLVYLFVLIYCFGTQLVELDLTGHRTEDWSLVLQALSLAAFWPSVILSWVISHIPVYISVYRYLVHLEVTTEDIKNSAASMLASIYQYDARELIDPDDIEPNYA